MRWRLAAACAASLGLVLVSGAAGDGPSRFALKPPTATVSTGDFPNTVQFADMNGDKKMDMVVSVYGPPTGVEVYLGNGKGAFTAGASVDSAGDSPTATACDLNGDGKPDVVATDYDTQKVNVWLNNGSGGLAPPQGFTPFNTGGQSLFVACGDFNGDHRMDFLVLDSYPANVQVVLQDQSGGFAPASNFQPGEDSSAFPDAAVVSDYNHDGKADFAVLDTTANSEPADEEVQTWLSNGDGTFTLDHTIPIPSTNPGSMVAGDFNGDGKPDLAVQTSSGILTLFGNGAGDYTVGPLSETPTIGGFAAADFNGDKKLDLYAVDYGGSDNQVMLLVGDGHGRFAASPVEYSVNAGPSPGALVLDTADVNGDRKPDVAVTDEGTSAPGQVSVLLWTSTMPVGPAITRATPTTGLVGDTITLTGKNLQNVAGVSFGGPLGDIHQSTRTPTTLLVDVPDDALYGKLSLITDKGVVATSIVFTPIEAPQITSVSPAGAAKPGSVVTVNGIHLSGTTSVTLGATALTKLKVTDAKVTATLPVNTPLGAQTLTVTNPVDHDTAPYGAFTAPHYDSFAPTDGPANATKTTEVTVNSAGAALLGVTSVLFNGKAGTGLAVASDGASLTVSAPAGATSGPITVKNAAGTFKSGVVFTVDPQPKITSLSVTTGGSGAPVTITGQNLIDISTVKFGDGTASSVDTTNAPASITANVPSSATPGKVTLIGVNGTAVSAQVFQPAIAPSITGFAPSGGAVVGSAVTISGHHFTGATHVDFNGTVATFKVVSDSTITTKVPVGAAPGQVTVTNPTGSDSHSYYVIVAPTVTSFSPLAAGSGTSVVIQGTGFTPVTAVTFNNVAAASYTVDSDTQITATPPSSNATGTIKVTNAAGSATSASSFTLVSITSFTPTTAAAGQQIDVTGVGLDKVRAVGHSVFFTSEISVDSQSATDLKFTLPTCGPNSSGSAPIYLYIGAGETNYAVSSGQLNVTGPISPCPPAARPAGLAAHPLP